MLPAYETLQGVRETRVAGAESILMTVDQKKVPQGFPIYLWSQQTGRYFNYWRWFDGTELAERLTRSKDGSKADIMKYPLEINPIRNFSRKHASVLMGEESFETPTTLVKPRALPQPKFGTRGGEEESEFAEDDKTLARAAEDMLNEVWEAAHGRALQMENATISQFLGGCIFQAKWEPWKKDDLVIPITIHNIMPDFFLPIWESGDFWNLLEAYVIYKIPAYVAKEQYGWKGQPGVMNYVVYVEHWTRKTYSIYLDGAPLSSNYSGVQTLYKDVINPFGVVPFVYIPHLREGNFYGPSLVDDLRGLIKEYNARLADTGDAIRDTVHRKRYMRDVQGDAKPKQIDKNVWAINVGTTSTVTKASPHVWTEDPPNLSSGLTNHPDTLWDQMLREGSMNDVAFGEDEGSQRSGMTLLLRMWPTISHARAERTFWTEGLNHLDYIILRMMAVKASELKNLPTIPANFRKRIRLHQDWLPMVPRDRESMVNEVILRFQAGLLSPETAIKMIGDVEYIQEELKMIRDWMKFQAESQAAIGVGNNVTGKADSKMDTPVATSGTQED